MYDTQTCLFMSYRLGPRFPERQKITSSIQGILYQFRRVYFICIKCDKKQSKKDSFTLNTVSNEKSVEDNFRNVKATKLSEFQEKITLKTNNKAIPIQNLGVRAHLYDIFQKGKQNIKTQNRSS